MARCSVHLEAARASDRRKAERKPGAWRGDDELPCAEPLHPLELPGGGGGDAPVLLEHVEVGGDLVVWLGLGLGVGVGVVVV